jgi:nitrate reductase NapD
MTRSTVHIAGMLVHVRPEALDAAINTVRAFEGAEVHATGIVGKFAAVLECTREREIAECIEQLQAVPGVISVSMTSHYIEDAADLAAGMP